MRIIAGARKGLRLRAPHGKHVRPTSDRAREALMSVLAEVVAVKAAEAGRLGVSA